MSAPAWDDLPPKVERAIAFDRWAAIGFGLAALAAWGYVVQGWIIDRPTPPGFPAVVLVAGMTWAPWEAIRWTRKVQLFRRLRATTTLQAVVPNSRHWDDLSIAGGPSKPPPQRLFRQLLRFAVYQWNFRVGPGGRNGQGEIYAYPRAMVPLAAAQSSLVGPELWAARDGDHLALLEPRGKYVKVCRRARWVEAHPDAVLWWTSDD